MVVFSEVVSWDEDRPAKEAAMLSRTLGFPGSHACEEMEASLCWGFSENQPMSVMCAFQLNS